MPSHTYLDHGLTILQTQMQAPLAPQQTSQVATASPFITISREVCAGATTLGREMLPALDREFGREGHSWMFLDRDLLVFALTSHHLPERLAEFMPEDRVSEVKAVIGELVGLHPPLWELEHQVGETIRHLAMSGRVIFAGRAAHVITASLPGGFHVRLVAGSETRVRRLMAERGCPRGEAEEFIAKTDLARRRFLKTRFSQEIDDPHHYDLAINTDRMTPAAVARIVIEGLRQRMASGG